jgi:hypothetical protein
MIKAVIDRFEGSMAVLLVGDGQWRMEIPCKNLPDNAKEGDWLQLEIQDGEVEQIELDLTTTTKIKSRIADKLEKLRSGDHLNKK